MGTILVEHKEPFWQKLYLGSPILCRIFLYYKIFLVVIINTICLGTCWITVEALFQKIFPSNELIPLANMISVLLFSFSGLPVFVKEIKVQGVQAVEKKREKRSKHDPRKRDDHCYVLQVINDKSCRYRVLLKKKVQQSIIT